MTNVNTIDDLNKELTAQTVIADFWAEWCGPCKVMGPIFESLSEQKPDIHFIKIDVDSAPEIATQYGIRSIPTIIKFENGKETVRVVGSISKDGLLNRLKI